MDATRVDWSMGSQAARLADWDAALAIGRRVAGPGFAVPPVGARTDAGGLRGARLVRRGADHRVHLARSRWVPIARVGDVQGRLDPREPRRPPADAGAAGGPDPREAFRLTARSGGRRSAPRPAGSSATSRGGCWVNTTPSSRRTTRGCCTSSARTWPRWSSGSPPAPRLPAVDRRPRGDASGAVRSRAVAPRVTSADRWIGTSARSPSSRWTSGSRSDERSRKRVPAPTSGGWAGSSSC